MAVVPMDFDPFSLLELSLQEPDTDEIDDGQPEVIDYGDVDDEGEKLTSHKLAVLGSQQKLSFATKEEEKYRRQVFTNVHLVLRRRLHCTVCDEHVGAHTRLRDANIEHPLLKVLVCSYCNSVYQKTSFLLSSTGKDTKCRWCTATPNKDASLRFCSECPFAFCEPCINRNSEKNDGQKRDPNSWKCYACDVSPLWEARATLWALRISIETNFALKEDKWNNDQSTCCKQTTNVPQSITIPHKSGGKLVGSGILPRTQVVKILNQNNDSTQLYDTVWLRNNLQNLSTNLDGFNMKIKALLHTIPIADKKGNIKSKLASVVSLANMMAVNIQKANRELESEGRRMLEEAPPSRFARVQAKSMKHQVLASAMKRSRNQPIETINLDDDDEEEVTIKRRVIDLTLPVKPCKVVLKRLSHDELLKYDRNGISHQNKNRKRKIRVGSTTMEGESVQIDVDSYELEDENVRAHVSEDQPEDHVKTDVNGDKHEDVDKSDVNEGKHEEENGNADLKGNKQEEDNVRSDVNDVKHEGENANEVNDKREDDANADINKDKNETENANVDKENDDEDANNDKHKEKSKMDCEDDAQSRESNEKDQEKVDESNEQSEKDHVYSNDNKGDE